MDIQISVEELRKRKVFIATPMYGGQCTGLFMKSCLDLQGMLAGHGVESRFSFIFNESLITRARNYLCDEFIRSNFTHMLFIDADINFAANDIMALLAMDREIIGAGYPKKCLHADAQIQTENGPRTIRQIVEGGYKGKVRTLDATGQEIWRHVVNHFVEPNLDKKWVAVRTSKQRWRKPLIATTDHKLACVADIMDPQVSWIEAKDMRGNHLVERVSNQSINHHNALYNAEQLSVALGSALGDGHHGPKQKAYEAYKHEILGGAYYTNAQTKHLRTMLYPNGTKSLMGALPYLNEIALAFMYMNDGNLRTAPPVTRRFNGIGNKRFTCTIALHCFTKNEQLAFTKLLNDRWGIVAKLHVQGGGKYHEVFFDQGNAYKFLALIAPYVHESMNYKLDPDSRQITKRLINRQFLGFAASKVVSVVEQVTNSKLYDIEVEGTHCFFANNYLVHNSIKWWAIKEAILKHPNIEPSEIEKLVGDFVFNAVAGTEKFNIGEPIEVMEIGTGYMMIKREVFEKVANAMPYIRYKPDHVGQKFFDGSRYIDAYFDCYIDRQHTPDCKWDCAESHGSSERYLSEDYSFCQRARKVGVKVWLCPWMKTTHVGTYAFQGDLQAHANYIGKL